MEQAIPIPGLVAGCQEAEPSFHPWEKAEKGGALKSMLFWKVKVTKNPTKPASKSKAKNEKPSEDATATKSTNVGQESVDRTIYKLLTRQTGKRSNPQKRKGETNVEGEGEEEGEGGVKWRGPREEASEVPAQRKVR